MKKKSQEGEGTFWMLYDASGFYTGNSLWPTKRFAQEERDFGLSHAELPEDGKWRIKKVHVRFV